MTKPSLNQPEEFKKLLANYEVSEHGKKILSQIDLVLLRGPAAGGRNTIIRELIKTDKYEFVVSDTTRPPRKNDGVLEQSGTEYWFRAEDEILEDVRNGEYLEAELIHFQQVSGTSIRALEKALEHDKISVHEVHFGGVDNIVANKPDSHVIFITPPSFDEWIKRLRGRGEITDGEYYNRFRSAELDYKHALEHDYYTFVINDSYLLSTEHVRRIVETGDYPHGVQREARDVATEIYARIQAELSKMSPPA